MVTMYSDPDIYVDINTKDAGILDVFEHMNM